ncbi:hypothetical protein EOM39_04470 [Candidatus Gracilibacteria bacterium]|nr:hypothetical protein [Candidatus Gracilibacteria bacterium]
MDKKTKIWIGLAILVIFTVFTQQQLYSKDKQIEKAKQPSDVEQLMQMADIGDRSTFLQKRISDDTKENESLLLRKRCALDQIKRKASGLKINITYCKNKDNLEKYRNAKL